MNDMKTLVSGFKFSRSSPYPGRIEGDGMAMVEKMIYYNVIMIIIR